MHSNHTADLVLERLPSGEHAYLRPELEEDVRYVLTDKGRRDLAMATLFDQGSTVADVARAARFDCKCSASGAGGTCGFKTSDTRQLQDHYRDVHHWTVALCSACGAPQSAPDCARREHWGVS